MGFKKIILEFPAEGFTGEVVKHTLTKTNIANQPELAEKGLKEGDTIDIVKVEEKPTIVGDSEATKTKTTDPAKEKVVKVPKELSEVKGDRKRAKEISDAHSIDVVFENHRGEFFTTENLVRLSVDNDKTKIITHTF